MIWWMALAFAADCPEATTTAQVQRELEDAQVAFTELDIDAFRDHVQGAQALLPCLGDTLPRHLAAELHRAVGLKGEVDEDKARARQAFAAARSIAPEYRFPEEMVPADSPVRADYEAIEVAEPATTRVPAPAAGSLRFDGRVGTQRPTAWPTVVQVVDGGGGVESTSYLWPADALPPYTTRQDVAKSKTHRVPLVVTTAALAAGAGATYALAWQSRSTYNDPTTPDDRLDALRGRTNSLTIASGAVAAAAAGAGVAVAITW